MINIHIDKKNIICNPVAGTEKFQEDGLKSKVMVKCNRFLSGLKCVIFAMDFYVDLPMDFTC